LYRIDWGDGAFARSTTIDSVILSVTGSGLHPAVEEIQLVDYDPENFDEGIIADSVWDEPVASHTSALSFGYQAKTALDETTTNVTFINAQIGTDGLGLTKLGGISTSLLAQITAGVKAIEVEQTGSYTLADVLSVCLSVLAGRTTDSGAKFLTPDGSAARVTATVNASNERTGMVLDPSS